MSVFLNVDPLAEQFPGPTPDIDIDAKISLTQTEDILNIRAQVAGDNFPNTEMFISDPEGNRLFIGVDVRASGEDKNPTILFGPETEMIMNINMNVRTDANGSFIQVQKGNKWISRDEWNKQYLSTNPNP